MQVYGLSRCICRSSSLAQFHLLEAVEERTPANDMKRETKLMSFGAVNSQKKNYFFFFDCISNLHCRYFLE